MAQHAVCKRDDKAAAPDAQGVPVWQVYMAGPLFTLQERRVNRELAREIERMFPGCEVLLPQDFKHDDKFNDQRAFGYIFKGCIDGINDCQCMVAWLDGPDSDSGTCFEVGYAYAKGMPVIGVRTDFRLNQERGVNVMLSRACAAFVYRPSFDEDVTGLARDIVRALKKIAGKNSASTKPRPETRGRS
jgi:nucleoside 2-deoxyribosyltransferase